MGKGKEREMRDKDFEEEKAWLLLKDVPLTQDIPAAGGSRRNQAPGGTGPSVTNHDIPPEAEGGLECGCCFSLAPFVCFSHSQHTQPTNRCLYSTV